MKLLAVVLMLLTLGAVGEVVKDFKGCTEFFLNDQPPLFSSGSNNGPQQILPSDNHKTICQAFKNVYRFATLYDTARKIPVYSAYKYTGSTECNIKRRNTWRTETKLGSNEQASNNDYENSRYERGHLYPVCHAPNQEAAESTFALTNAAPQKCDFNKMWYHRVENRVRETLKNCPQKTAYIVTGVVPSDRETLKDEHGVNVPSHFWTAYFGDNNNCSFGGYIMGKEDDETKYDDMSTFQKALSALYKREIKVFTVKRP